MIITDGIFLNERKVKATIMNKPIKLRKIKKKKLTVAELKRRLIIGAKLVLVEFQKEIMNKLRIIEKTHSTYALLSGDEISSSELFYLKYPKASELTETEDGFIITNKFSVSKYKWLDDENDN